MDDDERQRQQALHEAIEVAVADELDEGELLAGWLVVYETAALDEKEKSSCGHFYGPREMTTWRALGLIEWARHRTLLDPDNVD
jgi:hypothetical protein